MLALMICAVVCVLRARAQGELYEGSPCKDPRGTAGQCAVLERCASARQDLRAGRRPRICAFDGFTPVVCCTDAPTPSPTTTTSTTTTTTTRPTPTSTPIPSEDGNEGVRSRQKCEEWGRSVFRLERPPVATTPFAPKFNRSLCSLPKGTPFIIGGKNTSQNEFPHMAAVGFGQESRKRWWCGGALISERFVLTAAHCIEDPGSATRRGAGPARWVRLGEHNILSSGDDKSVQEIPVEERFPHPGYRHNVKYNDIGLLRLARVAEITMAVRPACLHTRSIQLPSKASATGWGNTNVDGAPAAILQKINLPLVSQEECRPHFDPNIFPKYRPSLGDGLVDTMLCAGGEPFGGRDTCQGDSGGPLQILNESPYCTYTIIGVTSFGKSCAQPNTPAVYSRVSSYVPWIESIVWS